MESKFIVVTVLLILGYNSISPSSNGVHGLSETVSAGLYKLRANQELAIQTISEAHNSITNILSRLASKYIYEIACKSKPVKSTPIPTVTPLGGVIGLDKKVKKPYKKHKDKPQLKDVTDLLSVIVNAIKTDDIVKAVNGLPKLESIPSIDNYTTALLVEANRLDKLGFDYILNAIPYALGTSCDYLDKTKIEVHAYIDVIWLGIALAIDLTVIDDHSKTEAVIDFIESASSIAVRGMIGRIYNLLRTCSGTKDADLLALVDVGTNKTIDYFQITATSLLNGCRYLIAAVASGKRSSDLVSNIEESGDKMTTALRETINYISVTSEVFYIKCNLKYAAKVAAADLAANQYVNIVTFQDAKEAAVTIYDEIIYQITRKKLGIQYDGKEVFSRKDIARARLAANFKDGIHLLMKLMLRFHPESSSKIMEAEKTLRAGLIVTSGIYVKIITIALDPYISHSNVSATISDLKNKAIAISRETVDIAICLIRNGEKFSDKIEAKFAKLHDAGISGMDNSIGSYVHAVKILAKLVRKKGVVASADYSTAIKDIRAAEQASISAMYNESTAVSEASLLALMKNI